MKHNIKRNTIYPHTIKQVVTINKKETEFNKKKKLKIIKQEG